MACQFVQKKLEEKWIEEGQAAKAQNSKILACCDDDDDYNSAITPNEPVDSLSMGDEHLNTIPKTESNELIKSYVENLVPNPRIDDTDCHPENEIRLIERLLYDNSYPRPSEEFVSDNSDVDIESFSPSPIPDEDSDFYMEEIDLSFNPDDSMPPGIEDDDDDSEGDTLSLERLLHDDPIPLQDTLDFSYDVRVFLPFFTYPVTSLILLSSGSEDTIFDPGIHHFSSLEPGVSHRRGTFMKFNESPMEILSSTCSPMDQ
nr:hypothetical protein [Tanacetum cinerariifolium]